MKILFLHGGPGMNTFAESDRLGQPLRDAGDQPIFWNEPSATRPQGWPFRSDGAFANSVQSAVARFAEAQGEPVDVVAHSFGCNLAWDLLERVEGVRRLFLVTPAFSANAVFRRVMGLAEQDFRASRPEASARLEQLLGASSSFQDEPMREGLRLAGEDPLLFTHYWNNKVEMEAYFAAWARQGAGLDLPAFESVLADFSARLRARGERPEAKSQAEVTVLFGRHDPIVSESEERQICERAFPGCRFVTFDESGHFPHLEQSARFLSLLR